MWVCAAAAGPSSRARAATAASSATIVSGVLVVTIKDFSFVPNTITVPVGTTVTWQNLDEEPHTVRGSDAHIRSDALDQGDSYSVRFDQPGTYQYGCSIHPKMSGSVIVQ